MNMFRETSRMIPYIRRLSTRVKLNTLAIGFVLVSSLLACCSLILGHYTIVLRSRRESLLVADFMNYKLVHKWQEVRTDNAYVLEAFYDTRDINHDVKVIGIEKLDQGPRHCLLWYAWRLTPTVVKLETLPIPEHHGKDYWPYIYSCPVNKSRPIAVSLARGEQKKPSNLLTVRDISKVVPSEKVEFTVCVAPLHREYDNYRQLVEAIELYKMFGARKIVIYIYSIGPTVSRVLSHYIEQDLVDVIKWSIPVSEDEIHYFGQVPAANDCVYQYMHRTTYLVFSDLDECIVPRGMSHSWKDTIQKTDISPSNMTGGGPPMRHGAYVFQNAFFPLDCENSPAFASSSLIKYYNITTLLKTIRLSQLWPHSVRSKYIVRPEAIAVTGIHHVWLFLGRYTHVNVSSNLGVLHHYRDYLRGCDDWKADSFMWQEDKSMFKFRREITKRIWRMMVMLGDCGRDQKSNHIPSLLVQHN